MPERPSRRHRCRALLLLEELFPAPGISSDGGRAWLLLGGSLGLGVQGHHPCVKGEGEAGADHEGELEAGALAAQCLAKLQALGCQLSPTHCSHFRILLNYELSVEGPDNQDILPVQKSKLNHVSLKF